MTDARRKAAEEWAMKSADTPGQQVDMFDAHLAGQECMERRAVELICKRLRYWQKELNVAFDYAADIENGGWKEGA